MTEFAVVGIGPDWSYVVTDEGKILVTCPTCQGDVEMPYEGDATDAVRWPYRFDPLVKRYSEKLRAECIDNIDPLTGEVVAR